MTVNFYNTKTGNYSSLSEVKSIKHTLRKFGGRYIHAWEIILEDDRIYFYKQVEKKIDSVTTD